jgi:hypothetical protein
MNSTFQTTEQKEHLQKLGEILIHIESCSMLSEIDPKYYNDKKQEYITEYCYALSTMAQSVFNKPSHISTVELLGDVKI